MSDPIVVPISTPGGVEAAATVRRFGEYVGAAAVMHDKLTAATAKAVPAVRAEEQATAQSTQVHQHHMRTVEQETARLKLHEEQLRITAAARRQLGESFNVQDIGAMRRFARSSLGGLGRIGGEVGRGAVEGIEGMEGGGLRAGLGMAGAGLAAGFVAVEGLHLLMDHVKEEFNYELDARREMTESMRKAMNDAAALGTASQNKNESSLRVLTGMGGGLAGRAQDMLKSGILGAPEGLADLATRFGPGKALDSLTDLGMRASSLSGKRFDEIAKGLNVGHITSIGTRGMDQTVGDILSVPGHRVSAAEVAAREARLAASALITNMNRDNALTGSAEAADIGHIGDQEGPLRGALAGSLHSNAQAVINDNNSHGKQLQDAQARAASWTAAANVFGSPVDAVRELWDMWGDGPDVELRRENERRMDFGNAQMGGSGIGHDGDAAAADAARAMAERAAELARIFSSKRGGGGWGRAGRRPGQSAGAVQ